MSGGRIRERGEGGHRESQAGFALSDAGLDPTVHENFRRQYNSKAMYTFRSPLRVELMSLFLSMVIKVV